jgi:hypothetical protein
LAAALQSDDRERALDLGWALFRGQGRDGIVVTASDYTQGSQDSSIRRKLPLYKAAAWRRRGDDARAAANLELADEQLSWPARARVAPSLSGAERQFAEAERSAAVERKLAMDADADAREALTALSPRERLSLFSFWASLPGEPPSPWRELTIAEAALPSGRRKAAEAALRKAEALDPGPESSWRVDALRRGLGRGD